MASLARLARHLAPSASSRASSEGPSTSRGRASRVVARAVTLYGSPGSRSPLVNWYAEEIGLEMRAREPSDPTNPHPFSQVPALRDDDDGEGASSNSSNRGRF